VAWAQEGVALWEPGVDGVAKGIHLPFQNTDLCLDMGWSVAEAGKGYGKAKYYFTM
jgi:hypothetical protein